MEVLVAELVWSGYIEIRSESQKLLLRSFKHLGNTIFVMDNDPKRFRAVYFDDDGNIIEEKYHEYSSPHELRREQGTPAEDDGIVR